MPARSCRVAIQDMDGVSHTVEVTAATLYEAVAQKIPDRQALLSHSEVYVCLVAVSSGRSLMGKEILASEVDLVLEKLHSESTPLVGYYVRDGVKVMKRGVLAGVSREHGVVIANDAGSTPAKDYLAVKIGFNAAGVGCTFGTATYAIFPPKIEQKQSKPSATPRLRFIARMVGG